MKRIVIGSVVAVCVMLVAGIMAASVYMLDYTLAPEAERGDTTKWFRELYAEYPETREWVDSLKQREALRDTFVLMPTGERHHAYYVNRDSGKTAMIIHGWRDCAIDFFYLARMYERELGYNVVIPDLHAHGLSEGDMIQMGWLDRLDALHWLSVFKTDTMVVHGVSMGAATTMMLSAETMPEGIRDLHFIEDCGYTDVWEELEGELSKQFGLGPFPLMYCANWINKLWYGWSFKEASALQAVEHSSYPMLFIHGDQDTFVPTEMCQRLFSAKRSMKEMWLAEGAEHAESFQKHPAEYMRRVKQFLETTPLPNNQSR